MTEAIWTSIGLAAVATAVMAVSGVWLSRRGAARIDRLSRERRGLAEPHRRP